MGFNFSYLCDLLSNLEDNQYLKVSTAAKTSDPDIRTVSNWFRNHSKRIHAHDTDLLAFLSCLFPEKRTDRVYWLQHASLARVIARCLLLGVSRREELDCWRQSGGEDLGQCVENVMRQAENQILPGQEVTVEEIDDALNRIASRCRFSGPRVRRQHTAVDVDEALGSLYRRLSSRDAKWLTRMILKSYYPVVLPVDFVLRNVHFLLPHLLLFQDSLEAAVNLLKGTPLRLFPPRPQPDVVKILNNKALEHLAPRVGIKIGRPEFYKARSIKHCCKMIGRRRMSLERKYDGEYCQIHIDLSNPQDFIRIFSKSGKDSTADRAGVHRIIRQCLRLGKPDCKFSRHCILEGEMLVWSDKDERILEFHKLRKFITRSGTLIGADYDSQPKPYEHLMIMFFDILLLDDNICLTQPHRNRRLLLKDTIRVIPGRADIAEHEIIDFSRPDGQERLRRAFSRSIAERWEGYVLKACDEPYFAILSSDTDDGFCRWIKLKKDYIPGLGDTADFALIGARYESKDAAALKHIRNLSWTHFYIGCLENKNAVKQFGARPKFRVVDVIGRQSLNATDMQVLNHWGQFYACNPDSNSTFEIHIIHTELSNMDVVFKTPFVVEVLGSGFDKPSNTQYFTLRFPRVLKIHWDRTYEETISFSELQDLAEKARSVSAEELSQEDAFWSERLKAVDGKSDYIIDKSQSSATTSPRSTLTMLSPQSAQKTVGSNVPPSLTVPAREVLSHVQVPAIKQHKQHSQHSLDDATRRATKRRVSSHQEDVVVPRLCKKPKVFTTPQGAIPIFIDRTQATSPTPQDLDDSSRFLKDIGGNMSSQQSDAVPNQMSTVGPSSASFGQDGNQVQNVPGKADSVPEKAPIEPEAVMSLGFDEQAETVIAKGHSLNENIESSQATSAVSEEPKHREIDLQSPLVTLPVYCGKFFFTSPRQIEHIFRGHAREFTFAVCHFVESLGFPRYRDALMNSNPDAVANDIALGIVLIDPRAKIHAIAKEIFEVGNEVANTIKSGWPELPSKGKIFFLNWHTLQVGTGVEDRKWCLKSRWAEVARSCFQACISWGYGLPADVAERRKIEAGRFRLDDEDRDRLVGTDVITLWDYKELEILGEFASIDPLIHVSGERYEDTGFYA